MPILIPVALLPFLILLVFLPVIVPGLIVIAVVVWLVRLHKFSVLHGKVEASARQAVAAADSARACWQEAQRLADLAKQQPENAREHERAARDAYRTSRDAVSVARQAAARARKEAASTRAASIVRLVKGADDAVHNTKAFSRQAKAAMRQASAAAADAAWADLSARIAAKRAAVGEAIPESIQTLFRGLRGAVDGTRRHKQALADASIAVCAMFAAADGEVREVERQHVHTLIETNGILSARDSQRLGKAFTSHCDAILRDRVAGTADVPPVVRPAIL